MDNGDIHFVRDVKVDETKFLFSGSRQGKFIRDDDGLLDREGSGPELSLKHNRDDDKLSGNDSDDDYDGPDDDLNKEPLLTNRTRALPVTPPNSPSPAGAPDADDDDDDDAPLIPPAAAANDNYSAKKTAQASFRSQRIRNPVDYFTPVHLASACAATYDLRHFTS